MTDVTKMVLGVIGFFVLFIIAGITKSTLLMCIVIAIVSYIAGAILQEPYEVITVKPKERKSIEVKGMEVED